MARTRGGKSSNAIRKTKEAQSSSSQMKEEMDKQKSSKHCCVCFNSYDATERRPRVLPCGHTFCSKCISDNLQEDEMTCPSCQSVSEAESCTEYPINFALESIIEDLECDRSRGISKKLKSVRGDVCSCVEDIRAKSQEILFDLQQYHSQLEEWEHDHQTIANHHQKMVNLIRRESLRVIEATNEENEARTKLEVARGILFSASTAHEIYSVLEDVNFGCEVLDHWTQKTKQQFPNAELILQSKKLRERSKARLLSLSACRDEEEDDEDEEAGAAALKDEEKMKREMTCPNDPPGDYKRATSSPSIQNKIKWALENTSSQQNHQSVQTCINSKDQAVQLKPLLPPASPTTHEVEFACAFISPVEIQSCEMLPPHQLQPGPQIPFTLKINVQDLLDMTPLVKQMVGSNRVFAVHKNKTTGKRRFARITMKGNPKYLCLHVLGNPESPPPPVDSFFLQFDDIMRHQEGIPSCQWTFLELGVGKGSLGRILIRLFHKDENPEKNFALMCTGEMGPSYVHSIIWEVGNKGHDKDEFVSMGDYDRNDGSGGKAVVEGVDGNWWTENHRRPLVKGIVKGYTWLETNASQFVIHTGDSPSRQLVGCLGVVEEGLDVLTEAIKKHPNEREIKIRDCGILLYR